MISILKNRRPLVFILNTALIAVACLSFFMPREVYATHLIQNTEEILTTKVAPGEFLPVSIKLVNFGNDDKVDVTVSYQITNLLGDIIFKTTETVAVQTTASFIETIPIPPETIPGRYILKSTIVYLDQVVPAVSQFDFTVESKIFGLFQSDFYLYGGIILLVIVAVGFLANLLIRRSRAMRLNPMDYSGVPPDQRVFYELISDTVMGMRQRVGDVALDIAGQIDGLVIDKETGRILNITKSPSKVIAELVSGYETVLGKKVSFSFRRP